jgi:hypothetical protein
VAYPCKSTRYFRGLAGYGSAPLTTKAHRSGALGVLTIRITAEECAKRGVRTVQRAEILRQRGVSTTSGAVRARTRQHDAHSPQTTGCAPPCRRSIRAQPAFTRSAAGIVGTRTPSVDAPEPPHSSHPLTRRRTAGTARYRCRPQLAVRLCCRRPAGRACP